MSRQALVTVSGYLRARHPSNLSQRSSEVWVEHLGETGGERKAVVFNILKINTSKSIAFNLTARFLMNVIALRLHMPV
jgi:hypothetical protein